MKTIIILTLLIILSTLTSCDKSLPWKEDGIKEDSNYLEKATIISDGRYEILIIDDCEYILFNNKAGINLAYGYMSHKGNCNNPIHAYLSIDTLNLGSEKYIEFKNENHGGEKD